MRVLVFYDFPFPCPIPPPLHLHLCDIMWGVRNSGLMVQASWRDRAKVLDSRSENFACAYNTPGNLRLA